MITFGRKGKCGQLFINIDATLFGKEEKLRINKRQFSNATQYICKLIKHFKRNGIKLDNLNTQVVLKYTIMQ